VTVQSEFKEGNQLKAAESTGIGFLEVFLQFCKLINLSGHVFAHHAVNVFAFAS